MHSLRIAYDNSFNAGEPLAEYKQEMVISEGRIRKSGQVNGTPKEKKEKKESVKDNATPKEKEEKKEEEEE